MGCPVLSHNSNGINDVNPDIIKIDQNRAMVVWSSGKRGNSVIFKQSLAVIVKKLAELLLVSKKV